MVRDGSEKPGLTTNDYRELSDSVRILVVTDDIQIYKQPGGCIEIWQFEDGVQDIVHICESRDLVAVIGGLAQVNAFVPSRF